MDFGYKAQVVDNAVGDRARQRREGNPADAPLRVPTVARILARSVTADRGYGETAIDAGLEAARREKKVVIPEREAGSGRAQLRFRSSTYGAK